MIIVALDNEEIFNEIFLKYSGQVYPHDITYKEGVIQIISKLSKDVPLTLITRDLAEKSLTKEMYIKQLKLLRKNIKVIFLTEVLEESFKEFLFSLEVFNILVGNEVNMEHLFNSIEEDTKVIYKESSNEAKSVKEVMNNTTKENNFNNSFRNTALNTNASIFSSIISKKNIAIFGTSGSGKSYFANILSKLIRQNLNLKIGLLDLDMQNGNSDIYNNLDNNYSDILSKLIEESDKGKELKSFLKEKTYISKDNIYYLTNNISIFDYQNKLNEKYYSKIYDYFKENCDINIIDLPSFPFIDIVPYTLNYVDKIFFVISPNYISIRQALKYLELLTKMLNVSRDKISIVINKFQKGSLDISQIKTYFKGFDISLILNFDVSLESAINSGSSYIIPQVETDSLFSFLNLPLNIKNKRKNYLFDKLQSIFSSGKCAL